MIRWLLVGLLSACAWAQTVSLDELRRGGQPQLLMTWCPHCPCCRRFDTRLLALQKRYPAVLVRALDAHPQDTPELVQAKLKQRGLALSVVFDPQGQLCRLFQVRTTTTAMLWNASGRLVYLGNMAGVEKALRQMLAGQPVHPSTTPQSGCPLGFLPR